MGYSEAMEAAGAKVLEFQTFGSYQGDWWAKVEFEGRQYWVHGHYGSCSVCDAYEATFDYCKGQCKEHRYMDAEGLNCTDCATAKEDYQKRLAEFGESYLVGNEHTQEEAEKANTHEEGSYRSEDDAEALEFIKAHPLSVLNSPYDGTA